jgi:hypothetical protein
MNRIDIQELACKHLKLDWNQFADLDRESKQYLYGYGMGLQGLSFDVQYTYTAKHIQGYQDGKAVREGT